MIFLKYIPILLFYYDYYSCFFFFNLSRNVFQTRARASAYSIERRHLVIVVDPADGYAER